MIGAAGQLAGAEGQPAGDWDNVQKVSEGKQATRVFL